MSRRRALDGWVGVSLIEQADQLLGARLVDDEEATVAGHPGRRTMTRHLADGLLSVTLEQLVGGGGWPRDRPVSVAPLGRRGYARQVNRRHRHQPGPRRGMSVALRADSRTGALHGPLTQLRALLEDESHGETPGNVPAGIRRALEAARHAA